MNEPLPVRLANARFLSGHRREWLIDQTILGKMRCCTGQLAGMSIADAEQTIQGHPRQLVRPALMHLLWCHECSVNFDEPLRPSTVLEALR